MQTYPTGQSELAIDDKVVVEVNVATVDDEVDEELLELEVTIGPLQLPHEEKDAELICGSGVGSGSGSESVDVPVHASVVRLKIEPTPVASTFVA